MGNNTKIMEGDLATYLGVLGHRVKVKVLDPNGQTYGRCVATDFPGQVTTVRARITSDSPSYPRGKVVDISPLWMTLRRRQA